MEIRDLSFIAELPAPKPAAREAVAMCSSEVDAIEASLHMAGRAKKWIADRLQVSRSYFTEVTRGQKRLPDWMIEPLCALTGTTLLAQYRDLQRALRLSERREAEVARIERIAAAARGVRQ